MNDEQKQIEEMAEIMCDDFGASFFAEKLYDAGYRKQSDTAREILQMIKDKGLFRYGGYLLHDSDFDTVGKLYGVEVEE